MTLGGTITELQSRMSVNEFKVWVAYRSKYGPMSDVRRYDAPGAIIASLISQAHGGKAKPKDFMPYGQREEATEATIDDFVKAFGKGVKLGKRRKHLR